MRAATDGEESPFCVLNLEPVSFLNKNHLAIATAPKRLFAIALVHETHTYTQTHTNE